MVIYTILVYGIPIVLAITAAYVGILGLKFHLDEVVRRD